MNDLPKRESLTVEFKSDLEHISDDELVEAIVGMANTRGGEVFVGVEDDGRPTGLHPKHRDGSGLAALIGNKTVPPVSVRTELIIVEGVRVVKVNVPQSRAIVATSGGKILRRRLKADGTPETAPLYPYEITQRLSSLRLLDLSAQPLADAALDDLDPVERERLREIIRKYNGEKTLLDLSNEELDGALGFAVEAGGRRLPTLAGVLCIGRESRLRQLVPTHEAAFQVLDGTEVRVNDFFRSPLLKLIEQLIERFHVRNPEQELEVSPFRVPVPEFDPHAYREALVNAFTHRDYSMLGTVFVSMTEEGLTVSNPGGFVEGVTPDNLLTVQPSARNPYLADALKRIGLAERTGRGVDRIFEGMLRFGRPVPDYSRTTATTVLLHLQRASGDFDFMRMILREEQRTGARLPVETLIVLSRLRDERRLDLAELARAIQQSETHARSLLEQLVEAGLIEGHGTARGRTYTLSARVYRAAGERAEYVRQAGFDPIQQEQMVLKFVEKHGRITRREVVQLCRIGPFQATRLLRRLVREGRLLIDGSRRGTFYKGVS